MSIECKQLVDAYVSWLKTKTIATDVNGACEITTPFLDRHNDRLQIYVQRTPEGLRLTDDGYIIGDLESSGCTLDTPARKQMLETTLNGFGVKLSDEGELFVEASAQTFPQKKHALVQAMLAVNDMFMTAKEKVKSFFSEDVSQFLEANEIRFTPKVNFTGKSGFVHRFDFVIPHSRNRPERILRAINSPSRDSASSLIFAWTDSKENRPRESRAYAMLNDSEGEVNQEVLEALQQYEITPIRWTQRNAFVDDLVG